MKSVNMGSAHCHRAFIFHVLIGLDGDIIPIGNILIRSKVKVRRISFYLEKC